MTGEPVSGLIPVFGGQDYETCPAVPAGGGVDFFEMIPRDLVDDYTLGGA